jgi:hypothetical protein
VSTFTPGPWYIHPYAPHETDCREQHGFLAHTVYIGAPGDVLLAELAAFKFEPGRDDGGYPRVADFEVNMANARLIACAPDLLDALQDALEYIEACSDVRDGPDGVPQPNRAMQLAEPIRAVIAKAEGKA